MTSTTQPATATVTGTVPSSIKENIQNSNDEYSNLSTKRDASWPSVLFYIHLNILGLYGIMVLFTNAYLTTVMFTAFLSFIGIIGVTCGAHRLWAHRTYTANTFLKLFLMLCQTMAGQVNISHVQVFSFDQSCNHISCLKIRFVWIEQQFKVYMNMNIATFALLILFTSPSHSHWKKNI